MNLMNMVRLFGLVLIAWTLTALGFGLCRSKVPPAEATHFFLPRPALHEAVAVSRSQLRCSEEYRLLDRSIGKVRPLPLPKDVAWSFVTVAPWRDQNGNLEAVGRWSRPDPGGDHSFYGLGLFRVSDSKVVRSVDLDVLPTGKPCWVPGSSGDLLFPAGDGQLYRCRLARDRSRDGESSEEAGIDAIPSRSIAPYPVAWRCAAPGTGTVVIADPVWPADKPFRSYVFASLGLQTRLQGKPRNAPAQIWWLEMSEDGDEILSAGRLTVPANRKTTVIERAPSVSVGPAGQLSLAYLARARNEFSWHLCIAALSLDPATGKPRIAGASEPIEEVADALLPLPPTFSTDGQSIFASATDGEIKEYSLTSSPTKRKPVAIQSSRALVN